MNTRSVGKDKELLAAKYLKDNGYEVIDMNFSCKSGEVDIVAKDGEYLVFCEVKYRKTEGSGNPLEAISITKQRKITNTSIYYCKKNGFPFDTPIRFDVVSILGENITVIKNAFEAVIY